MKQIYIKPSMKVVIIHHKPSLLTVSGGKASNVNGNAFSGPIKAGAGTARSYDGGYDGDWGDDDE